MSAIQTFFRTWRNSRENGRAKYSDAQNRDKREAFERSGVLFSGRGVICWGAGNPRSADSPRSRILI
jgi:hypothetical protein